MNKMQKNQILEKFLGVRKSFANQYLRQHLGFSKSQAEIILRNIRNEKPISKKHLQKITNVSDNQKIAFELEIYLSRRTRKNFQTPFYSIPEDVFFYREKEGKIERFFKKNSKLFCIDNKNNTFIMKAIGKDSFFLTTTRNNPF